MNSILALLQFTTILPLGKPRDFDAFARHSWIYPLAGYVIALLVAVPVFFISDKTLAAAVAVAGVIVLSGAHHFDGLLDTGDGLMAHGDSEKRVHALTDRYVGAGGIAAGIVVTLLFFSGLQAVTAIIPVLIIGEVGAKFSMAFLTVYGIPFKGGDAQLPSLVCPPIFSGVFAPALCPVDPPSRDTVSAHSGIYHDDPVSCNPPRNCQHCFGGVNGDIVGASTRLPAP
jgi:cobalamin 5'-phosphate synthase/cobalamin synthase